MSDTPALLSGAPLIDTAAPGTSAVPSAGSFGSPLKYGAALLLLVVLTVGDGVLAVLLFDVWNERLALFVNQGTAAVYIVWSVLALACLRHYRGPASAGPSVRFAKGQPVPWYVLVIIGMMNGSANFCQAISQPHTPGLSQTLLGLLGIPLVLGLAWLCLGRRPSLLAVAGALLIVAGTAISGLRVVLDPSGSSGGIEVFGWAIGLFGAAQLILSGEKVFEEATFGRFAQLQPMVMFCWTLCTQFTLGWALYPIQTVPAFGGIRLSGIPTVVRDGALCAVGVSTPTNACSTAHAALFWSYCAVDFWCYFCGLWVIQRGGASLMVLSSAIALPLQQLVLCVQPLLGARAESFFWGDGLALGLVLVGFAVNQGCSPEGRAARRPAGQRVEPAPTSASESERQYVAATFE